MTDLGHHPSRRQHAAISVSIKRVQKMGEDNAAVLAPPGVVPLENPGAEAPHRQRQHPAQHRPAGPTPRAHPRVFISIRLSRHAHEP